MIRIETACRRALLVGLLLAAWGGLPASPTEPSPRLDVRLRHLARLAARHGAGDDRVREAMRILAHLGQVEPEVDPPRIRVRMLVDTDDLGPFRAAGAEIQGRMGRVVSARVPVTALDRLGRLPGVVAVRPAKRYYPSVDIGRVEVRADVAANRFGLTGQDVLIAVVDTGIDWQNFDFRHFDGTTRIAAIWDQTDGSGFPPSGFATGTLYTRQDIDDALVGFAPDLVTRDGFGHGTHVAGTALGNGLATGNGLPNGVYPGVAPGAELLVVRVFTDSGRFCGGCDLVTALSWIDQQATALGKPVVVNMSLGSDYGPHDGTALDEIAIDNFTGKGRAVVISAGNSRNDGIHTEGDIFTGGLAIRTFGIPAYTPSPLRVDGIYLDMWHDPADTLRTVVRSPGGAHTCTHESGDGLVVCSTADGYIQMDDQVDPVLGHGDRELLIQVSDAGSNPPATGTWTVRVEDNGLGGSGHFDIWIYDWDFGGPSFIDWNIDVLEELVGSPATAVTGIAVGAYTSRQCWPAVSPSPACYSSNPTLGEITSFSSPGPTRDDPVRDAVDPSRVRRKPDVAAPGQGVVASLSDDAPYPGDAWTTPDGVHRNWQGTSMAAPHVAGVSALLFEANNNISGANVRRFLRQGARDDAFSEAGDDWGWGKVDADGALEDMLNLITDLQSPGTGGAQFGSVAGIADAASYNVYRGSIANLDGSDYGACFLSGLSTPDFTDTTPDPSPGTGYFYLMTAKEVNVEGSLGQKSDGTLRSNLNPCP